MAQKRALLQCNSRFSRASEVRVSEVQKRTYGRSEARVFFTVFGTFRLTFEESLGLDSQRVKSLALKIYML
jgi:hypothetical protein